MEEGGVPLAGPPGKLTAVICAPQLMWVGLWNIMTEGRVSHATSRGGGGADDETYHLFWTHDGRNAFFAVGGWLVCVWTDTITWQAGRWGYLWSPRLWGVGTRFQTAGTVARLFLGLLGMLAAWSGLNNAVDFSAGRRHYLRDILFVAVGLAGVAATHTVQHMAFVFSAAALRDKGLTHRAPLRLRLRELARCTVSFVCQSLIWLGSWNLMRLDYYDATGTAMGYYLHYLAALGLLCLYAAGSVVTSSWIVTAYAECPAAASEAPTAVLYVRALVSIAGYLMWNSGVWVLVDVHGFPNSLGRNVAYTAAGAALCYVTNSLTANIAPEYGGGDGDGSRDGDGGEAGGQGVAYRALVDADGPPP